MTELRAPDPTLTAWALADEHRVLTTMPGPVGGDPAMSEVLVAHKRNIPCRTTVPLEQHRTRFARWFAVPCRECFPDAPPPGFRLPEPDDPDERYATTAEGFVPHPNLAWQVAS